MSWVIEHRDFGGWFLSARPDRAWRPDISDAERYETRKDALDDAPLRHRIREWPKGAA